MFAWFLDNSNIQLSAVKGQIDAIVEAIERRDRLDRWPILKALSDRNRGVGIERIANMLRVLRTVIVDGGEILGQSTGIDLDALATPRKIGGKSIIPIRLIVLTIIYSHARVEEPGLQEGYSAQAALDELGNEFGPEVANFVAALVSHQTLLRAAWVHGDLDVTEVYPVMDGKVVFHTDESYVSSLCEGLTQTLELFGYGDLKKIIADGLLLHAICLECRHHPEPNPKLGYIPLSRWRDELYKAVNPLPSRHPGTSKMRILFLHYGRNVYQERALFLKCAIDKDWKEIVESAAAKTDNGNITITFAKTQSCRMWSDKDIQELIKNLACTRPNVSDPILATVGQFLQVTPAEEKLICDQLGQTFAVNDFRTINDKTDPTEFLSWALKIEQEKNPEWLSISRLLFMLRVIDSVHPFRDRVTVTPLEMPDLSPSVPVLREPLTIPLPDFDDPGESTDPWHPTPAVSRLVAATINNLAVSHAAHRVELHFISSHSDDHSDDWNKCIHQRLEACGASVIAAYVSQCRHRATHLGQRIPSPIVSAAKEIFILGIDVGGTSIKGKIYNASCSAAVGGSEFSISTIGNGQKYSNALDFANRIFNQIKNVLPQNNYNIAAIGVCWPGPIENNQCVAATSGILASFDHFSNKIIENDAAELRRTLDLAKAFLEVTGLPCFVLNDGEADILGRTAAGFSKPNTHQEKGLEAVIKCGTGLAFGLRYNGEVVPVLGELGKATLNLMDNPKPGNSFPGVFTKYLKAGAIPQAVQKDSHPSLYHLLDVCGAHQEKSQKEAHAPILVAAAKVCNNDELLNGLVGTFLRLTNPETNLTDFINEHFPPGLKDDLQKDATNASDIVAMHAADAIAALIQMFRVERISLCGGPLRGEFGKTLITRTKEELIDRFGMDVTDGSIPALHRPLIVADPNRIQLTQRQDPIDSEPGARGAAIAAYRAYFTK